MTTKPQAAGGFSLVEVVLALGVAAFCLVAIFGLLPVGINSNRTSSEQTVAANLASLVLADLQATPKVPYIAGQPAPSPGPLSPRLQIPAPQIPVSVAVTHTLYLQEDGSAQADASRVPVAPDSDAVLGDNPRYRVTLTYNVSASKNVSAASQPYFAVPVRVLVTWPALADPSASATPTNFSGSLEVSASLDRN